MYQVVANTDLKELSKEVTALLASRWELAGNLTVDYNFEDDEKIQTSLYLQPMRKR